MAKTKEFDPLDYEAEAAHAPTMCVLTKPICTRGAKLSPATYTP